MLKSLQVVGDYCEGTKAKQIKVLYYFIVTQAVLAWFLGPAKHQGQVVELGTSVFTL